MDNQLDLEVKDSVFDPNLSPNSKRVHVRDAKGKQPLYKVWLFLDGRDLPYVKSVTYTLHQTFPDPVRTVWRTLENQNCQLILWTWGLFAVKAAIEDKQGRVYEVVHNLSYDKQLKQKDIEYIYEDNTPPSQRPQLKRS